ncbi:PAS domain-containing protein (plasmid) [Skermanella sp. TT6]|uniref:PAS domain-containing protein n=1 Tax=Skermanella cutis TaxID=2775420 RepID=A0ABX7BEY0_9PROT|nr:PAS domain-containing protein [Skermanella sp. TT6]QQP92947.1 PAS domain-containing protein [Skermanella sp. TT6]
MSNGPPRMKMYSAYPNECEQSKPGIVEEPIDEATVRCRNFQSRLTEKLWHWWAEAGRDGVPNWSSFDVTKHAPLIPNIYVVRALDGCFQFRLYGERAIQIIGQNMTGQVIAPETPGAISEHLHDYFSRVLAGGQAWRCTGRLLYKNREHIRFESVDIPLIRYGAAPDTILGVIDLVS